MRSVLLLAACAVLTGGRVAIADAHTAVPRSAPPAPPLSIGELRDARFESRLAYERDLDDGASFSAWLASYRHTGLVLYAMVAVPKAAMPAAGFPVVVANHGYVPDPRRYGITSEGRDARPGDYYRSVPELFASRGFLVIMPDYRGHNSSAGFDYIDPQDERSAGYYAEDVVALLAALGDIEGADPDRVFMWSHSMGGLVALRTLLATDIVRGASFWSTMNVDDLETELHALGAPVIVHHATADEATPHGNSLSFVEALRAIGHPHVFHSYDGDAHFFGDATRELAADRDAEFFHSF